jgi:secreted trypsin-like serine protease
VKKMLAALAASITVLAAASSASAITYGQLDGNRHPEVGALVGTFEGETYPYCSGTLISPTVFLTAAHCDIGESAVTVTFASQYTSKAKLYAGTFYANPLYGGRQGEAHDIAVVVFSQPIKGIAPARLPTAGLFDQMKARSTLTNASQFTAVGYGGQERSFVDKGQWFIAYHDAREYSVSSYNSLNKGYMRLSQNPSHGDGGTCYGDSGGPNFLGAGANETNIIAGITITGDTPCTSTNVIYRLDTASARAFLGQFVALP